MGLVPLQEGTRETISQPYEDSVRRRPSRSQEAGPQQTLDLLEPCFWTPQPAEL